MKKNEKGFSLIELLVVVVIIAIVAAIAIPNLLASRRAANQSSTVANLRTIVSANATFASLSTSNFYGSNFAAISGGGYLDNSWTGSPVKNGYTFAYTSSPASGTSIVGYCVTATRVGTSSGDYSYAVSHQGVIYQLLGATAPACAADTGIISTGTVVGG